MKEAKEEGSKRELEQGFMNVEDMPKTIQPNQNARLTGKVMSCEDDEANEMDD